MAILSGCDYLESPPGIGIKKAQQLLLHTDAHRVIKSWQSWGKTMKAPKLPNGYLESFIKAELTFQHQRVFDSESAALVPLTPFAENADQHLMDFIGEYVNIYALAYYLDILMMTLPNGLHVVMWTRSRNYLLIRPSLLIAPWSSP